MLIVYSTVVPIETDFSKLQTLEIVAMKFSGPTHDGVDWNGADTIEITYESADELEKNLSKYFKSSRSVVRTSTKAKAGEEKKLVFHLPNGESVEATGIIEKVKVLPDKPYAMALFKLQQFGQDQTKVMEQALKAEESTDLDFGDDDFDMPLTNNYEPEASQPAKPAPVKAAAPAAAKPQRSQEDENRLMAYLSDDAPEDEDLIDVELPEELRGASGDLIMPKTEGEEVDPHLEHKKYIIAFVLLFTKSVQRSAYYGDKEHPEAKNAKKGLYALFRRIIGKRREVSFIRKSIGKEKDLLVDGVLKEMVTLSEIMPHGMAQLYIPRFLEYLERRCLISMSIKRIITEEKFDEFIDLLSQYSPEFRDDSRKEGERFTRTLIEHGVVEVSAIFDEDIIASGRKLPWQAELTLSRLKKDLKTVPLLKNATEEELRQIKIRIFQDTIRPLRNPSFMIAVLLNADLIMESIDDSPVLQDINVEEFMISGAEVEFLATTSMAMMKEIDQIREVQRKSKVEAQRRAAEKQEKVLVRIFDHITQRFLEEKSDKGDEAIETFFNHKLIPFKSLPMRIQEKITNKKLMEAFLQKSDEILERFNSPLSDKEFSDFINRFQRVIPLLSEKKEYLLVGRIIESSRKHLDDRNVRRKSLTKRLFDYIGSTSILKELKEVFESDDKELRNLAMGVFISFGRQSVPMLLDILKSHEDKWVRKGVIRAIQDVGQPAVQPMVNELYKEGNPWYFLRNVVNILGELGDRRIVGKLNLLLYHEHPAVREETVNALYRIAPETSETHLIKALDDEDMKVRGRAIACLGQMANQSEKVLHFYTDVLTGKAELENEALQIQVYRAVGHLVNLDHTRKDAIVETMLKNLDSSYGGGLMAMFKKGTTTGVSDSVKMAICSALGEIGSGKKVRRALNKVAKEKDPVLNQRAKESLRMLDLREGK